MELKEVILHAKEKGLSFDEAVEELLSSKIEPEIPEILELIGGENYMRSLPIALTHLCFRNGPIEGMHAGIPFEEWPTDLPRDAISQLSQEDMKTLNTYMVDYLGYFLYLLNSRQFSKLIYLLDYHKHFGSEWDDPNIKALDEKYMKFILDERDKILSKQ
ncbi:MULTISPECIES: hypothetical protein [Bacillus]|uniref:hypothetical protein n=1 Tax=Bacillus TaxID=1386 RepID=UPI00030AD638|nr:MULTISPECIES: hypothetical protein [Bacillus]